MTKREGPMVWIKATCSGCTHEHSESYRFQGDHGQDVSCTHPSNPGRQIGDTTWDTPEWCPLLPIAVEKLVRELEKRE